MAAFTLLADGTTAEVREATPADEAALTAMYAAMSAEHRYLRFLGSGAMGPAAARRACRGSGPGHLALLAVLDGEVIGVAEHEPTGVPGEVEVAAAVADAHHHRGVATVLLEHLVSRAMDGGVRTFVADTLAYNHPMLEVFADMGMRVERHLAGEVIEVRIPLAEDETYLGAVAERERSADVHSLTPLFRPGSVAVVGVSRNAGTVGRAVLDNLLAGGFTGPVYPVNPKADEIAGLRCYPSVADLPQVPDLAVVAVPAAAVPQVAEQCGERGIRALLVVTSGLSGEPGRALHDACRRHGIRMVGPNCLGIANTDPAIRMDATFGASTPAPGSAGVAVQSGGVGIAVLEHLSRIGVGISTFASLGDKFDVSGNDLLQWWSGDGVTTVGVLYLESFGNPRKFARTARRVTRELPVLTVSAGRSEAGQRAAASHTAAAATPQASREALFRQAGVIATGGLGELVATAALLSTQPLPAGHRLAIISNAGGAGVLAADACADVGLRVPPLPEDLVRRLTEVLPAGSATANPVDTTAAASVPEFRAAMDLLLASRAVDALIVAIVPTALGELESALTGHPAVGRMPVAAVLLDQPESVRLLTGADGRRLPAYPDPAAAAAALAHAAGHAARLRQPAGTVPDLADVDRDAARALVADELAARPGGGWLAPDVASRLLSLYGIPMLPIRMAHSADEAAAIAHELAGVEGPAAVVLKAYWPELVHKSDLGAVLLDLAGETAVRAGYRDLAARLGDRMTGVTVQPMGTPGLELLAGMVEDDVFGPLVVFGLGGTATDVLADRGARLTPLTDLDAAELVRSLRTAPLLMGYRGKPAVDVAAVEGVLVRLSQLADDLPDVAELDLNPLIARPDGVSVVDARVRVQPRPRRHPYLRDLP
jgi:acyl-CoA synthetase (NDP forming)/GNAT superfamily N-acetyltransferase